MSVVLKTNALSEIFTMENMCYCDKGHTNQSFLVDYNSMKLSRVICFAPLVLGLWRWPQHQHSYHNIECTFFTYNHTVLLHVLTHHQQKIIKLWELCRALEY